ncbi:hypothetical protein jhhlp_000776 [Lomentospora prolificans]|uniref:Phytocyanin domain-containing protein n=1 Tax=Lomentospora prolificans TaxID=41688 RepID=A0A2N3NJI4_9PEZI|nr:hypothetical protein jhhlp_000776 [Lomentospora prolificans]
MRAYFLTALVATANAAVHKINVGQGGLTYTPDTVKAEVGDILEFHFVGGTHDAVMTEFGTPCAPSEREDAFSSGVIQGTPNNNDVFHVTVNSTEPTFYYCSVGMHCANGMVAAINPTEEQTVAAYRAASQGKAATAPSGVYGGEFGDPLP